MGSLGAIDIASDWLARFARCVDARDPEAARALFADDVIAFGSVTAVMAGVDELERLQWKRVWPRISDFRFERESIHVLGDPASGPLTIALKWSSVGRHDDGRRFDRPGRATLVLERSGANWRCVHSHFSLVPGTRG